MLQELFINPLSFFVWAAALLMAVTVHEFAHAWMADRLGDPTARIMGRLTLNPLAHLDPIGTLMLLLFRVGWGKPVPFDPFNLRNPQKDAALISFAGSFTNIITSTVCAILIRILYPWVTYETLLGFIYRQNPSTLPIFVQLLLAIIFLNIALAIFNLIPIHPLDGGKVLVGILSERTGREVDEFLHRYGLIILLFLIFPFFGASPIIAIISPIINLILRVLLSGVPLV